MSQSHSHILLSHLDFISAQTVNTTPLHIWDDMDLRRSVLDQLARSTSPNTDIIILTTKISTWVNSRNPVHYHQALKWILLLCERVWIPDLALDTLQNWISALLHLLSVHIYSCLCELVYLESGK